MSWVVYILRCADDTLYTGVTNDLEKRLRDHENGVGAKYTRGRAPLKLVYQEECNDRSQAQQREYAIKALPKTEKLKLISL